VITNAYRSGYGSVQTESEIEFVRYGLLVNLVR